MPYSRGGNWPDDIHRILGAYEHPPGRPVKNATIVSVDGVVGGELTDGDVEETFDLRRVLSFAALKGRRFFQLSGYLNDHTFTCVVQNFRPGQDGVGISARRRDGSTDKLMSQGWRVFCPTHISPQSKVHIDVELAGALRTEMEGKGGLALRDAVELFNLANTDSPDVRPHTELLLSVAAAQRMLGVEKRSKGRVLAKRFAEVLDAVPVERTPSDSRRAIPNSTKATSLRQVWFEDFYMCRGAVAHGRPGGPPRPIWKPAEHLLLASYILPRVVLLRLATTGVLSLTDDDKSEIADFDHLLCQSNLFGPPDDTADNSQADQVDDCSQSWAWNEAIFEADSERSLRKHRPELERALAALFFGEDASATSDVEASQTEPETS